MEFRILLKRDLFERLKPKFQKAQTWNLGFSLSNKIHQIGLKGKF